MIKSLGSAAGAGLNRPLQMQCSPAKCVLIAFVGYYVAVGERPTRQTLRSKERRMSVGREWKTCCPLQACCAVFGAALSAV